MVQLVQLLGGLAMKPIYPDRESKILEFKLQLPHLSHLVKTCVAFANGVGGKIIIGVKDGSREIVGIDDNIRNRLYDEFPNCLYDSTHPSLLAEIYEKNYSDDLSVMIIEIFPSMQKPVFIKSEGMLKGVYLRAGTSTRVATEDYIRELKRENKRLSFDENPVHEDINILSDTLLGQALNRYTTERLLMEKIILRSTTSALKYYPTIAGVLLFCENPQRYIPEASIYCTRFRGVEGRDIIQTEEITGCLLIQVESVFELLKSWLTRDYKLIGSKLKGKTIIPEVAMREAIINALIHRKYWIPGAVKIAVYDNRLEIFSPGNFPGAVDLQHLGDGTTYLRNPHLVRLARRLGMAEKLGTGIRLILESCKKASIRSPEFIEGADSVKVIFYFLPEDKKDLKDEERILELFKMQNELSLGNVEHLLSISRNTATRKLNILLRENKILRIGKGPAVRYILKDS